MSMGILIGMSITQGGNGFPAFHPAVYHYMATGSYLNLDVAPPDIPDASVRVLIEKAKKKHYLYILMTMPSLHVGHADF